jgi:uncharacterized membrane protein
MKGLQLLAVLTVALLLGTTLSNVLDMRSALPVVADASAVHLICPGLTVVGGPLEIVTVLINLAVLTAALSRPHLLFLSGGAALCLVGAFSVWVVFAEPVDVMARSWTQEGLTNDWSGWRNQWEFSQLVRLLLHLAALLLLAASLLRLPADEQPQRGVAHG